MSPFQQFKTQIVNITNLSKDALHIYVGMGVLLGAALILRRSPGSLRPWLAVLIVACGLELGDMRDDFRVVGYWHWAASLHDILNTLFWPTVLMLLWRHLARIRD